MGVLSIDNQPIREETRDSVYMMKKPKKLDNMTKIEEFPKIYKQEFERNMLKIQNQMMS